MRRLYVGLLTLCFLFGLVSVSLGAGDVLWYTKISDSSGVFSSESVAVADDGTIYLSAYSDGYGGSVYAFNPNGSLKWIFTTYSYGVGASPVIGSDGTIYVGMYDSVLYAVNPDGRDLWAVDLQGEAISASTAAIDSKGNVYVGTDDGYFYSVSPDGQIRWSSGECNGGAPHAVIGSDDTVYVVAGKYVCAFNGDDGTLKWKFEADKNIYADPAIGADGTIYAADYYHTLYAIDSSGNLKWTYPVGAVYVSPVVDSDGTIYVPSILGYVVAVNPDGTKKWVLNISQNTSYPNISLLLGDNNTLYLACGRSGEGRLYAINKDGTIRWQRNFTKRIVSDLSLYNGAIYLVMEDSNGIDYLYAISSDSSSLASAPWPRYRHDEKNTGRAGASSVPSSGSPFMDISSSWAKDYIIEIYNAGITTGYPDGTYRPDEYVTRAQMAAFIARALNLEVPQTCTYQPFTDVPANSSNWACPYIEAIKNAGITSGYPDGTYRPDEYVTRAQMAAFIARAFLGEGGTPSSSGGEVTIKTADEAERALATGFYSGWLLLGTYGWINDIISTFSDNTDTSRSAGDSVYTGAYGFALKSLVKSSFFKKALLPLPKRAAEQYSGGDVCDDGGSYSYTGTYDPDTSYYSVTYTYSHCLLGNYEFDGNIQIKGTYQPSSGGDLTVFMEPFTITVYDSLDNQQAVFSADGLIVDLKISFDETSDTLNTRITLNGSFNGSLSTGNRASISYSGTTLTLNAVGISTQLSSVSITSNGRVSQSISDSSGTDNVISVTYNNYIWKMDLGTDKAGLSMSGSITLDVSPASACPLSSGTYTFNTKVPIFTLKSSYYSVNVGDVVLNNDVELVWNDDGTVSVIINGVEVAREESDDFLKDKNCLMIWLGSYSFAT